MKCPICGKAHTKRYGWQHYKAALERAEDDIDAIHEIADEVSEPDIDTRLSDGFEMLEEE